MYYYTYQIRLTNVNSHLNGCLYFGRHTTKDLNDNYICSGKIVKNYLKKYPNDYIKEILNFYDSQEELNKAEYELIHPHLGKDYCLNLTEGGQGAGAIGHEVSQEARDKISSGRKKYLAEHPMKGENHPMYGKHHSEETKLRLKETSNGNKNAVGYHPTEESKEKNRQAHLGKPAWNKGLKGYMSGEKNGMYRKHHSEEAKIKCGLGSKNKHRVYDNPEHTKWHMEY